MKMKMRIIINHKNYLQILNKTLYKIKKMIINNTHNKNL